MPEELNDQELTESQLKALGALRNCPAPPHKLEARVFAALREKHFLAPRLVWVRPLALAAAGVLLFIFGWTAAQFRNHSLLKPSQPQFLLLLEIGAQSQTMTSEQEKPLAVEYGQWARHLSSSGHSATGERLANSGTELQWSAGREIPWSAEINGVRRYFVVSARDLNEAVALARTCPHLKYGGKIEVRPIDTPR